MVEVYIWGQLLELEAGLVYLGAAVKTLQHSEVMNLCSFSPRTVSVQCTLLIISLYCICIWYCARMTNASVLSTVPLNCQVTKIVINSGPLTD